MTIKEYKQWAKNRVKHLQVLLKFTQKHLDTPNFGMGELMSIQKERISTEISKLSSVNKKSKVKKKQVLRRSK